MGPSVSKRVHLLRDPSLAAHSRALGGGEALEDAPGRRVPTSNVFYVAISRFLNGFITVNAGFALLSGSNEH